MESGAGQPADARATRTTRARYDRLAPIYDLIQRGAELGFVPWRAMLWRRVRGPRVLELGIGTGKNLPHYPPGARVIAFDVSEPMLRRARARAARLGTAVELCQADAQDLPFPDASFDAVVATCVFCSVPDPVRGLREARRVLAPGGQLFLLEHVLSTRPLLRAAMRLANPVVVRLLGANVDRDTVGNVRRAGFAAVAATDLWLDVVKLIEASDPPPAPATVD